MTYELRHPMGHIPIIHVTRMILTGWKRLIGCLKSQNDLYMTHIRIIPPSCHIRIIHVTYTRWRLITGCLICIRHFPQKSPIISRKRAQKSPTGCLICIRHFPQKSPIRIGHDTLTHARIFPPSCIYEWFMPLIIHITYEQVAEWLVTNHPSVMYIRIAYASHHPYQLRMSRRMIGIWHIHESSLRHVYTKSSCLSSSISLTNKSSFNIICLTDCTANADVSILCDRYFNMIIQKHSCHFDRKNPPPPGGFPIYYVPSSRTVCKRTPLEGFVPGSSRGVLLHTVLDEGTY